MTLRRTRRRRFAIVTAALVATLALVYALLRLTNPGVQEHPYFTKDRVMVIAHRGGVNLWPENTIYAFERALALGVDALEMDVRGTADDRLVLLHDETVDRTTDGTGAVRELTLTEVQALDAGYDWPDPIVTREREIAGDAYEAPTGNASPPAVDPAPAGGQDETGAGRTAPGAPDNGGPTPDHLYRGRGIRVPTLEEVLAAFPDVRMNIDLKETDPELIERFLEIMRRADRGDRTLLASFHPETVEAMRRGLPDYPISGVEPEIRPFVILDKIGLAEIYRPTAHAYQVPEYAGGLRVITASMTASAGRLGVHVDAWSAGSWDGPIVTKEDMRRLIGAGVDGVITDRPDLLLELLGRR